MRKVVRRRAFSGEGSIMAESRVEFACSPAPNWRQSPHAVPQRSFLAILISCKREWLSMRRALPVRSTTRLKLIGLALLSLATRLASADIYQWEWIDPADPSLGRQQAATLAVDGAGRQATPGNSHYEVDYTQAWLHGFDLRESRFTRVYLNDADLGGADLTGASLYGSRLAGAIFDGAQIEGASFEETEGLTPGQIYATASYQAKNLQGVNFGDRSLTGWDFAEQDMRGAYLFSARLTGADFTNAKIQGAHFGGMETGALAAAQLYSTASYQAGDLSRLDLRFRTVSTWDFQGQNLTETSFYRSAALSANFSDANLESAELFEADLRGADFSDANLTDADLYSAKLGGADLSGAEIAGARLTSTGLTAPQLYSTASYQTGNLRRVALESLKLDSWNFAGKDLTGASLRWSFMNGIDLSQAIVRDADFSSTTSYGFTSAALYATASYQAGDLGGIQLESNNLQGWNFAGQALTNADFYFADCANADFSGANLTGADLSGAKLAGADFNNATIRGASFSFVSEMTTAQFYSTASYQAGDLVGVRFRYLDLAGWDFANADLTNADFADAGVSGVIFTGAKITGADFTSATDRGFTAEQFYSTASYQTGNLVGIRLGRGSVLSGWNFSGKNLASSVFSSDSEGAPMTLLKGANFSHANLTDGHFLLADVTGASFVGADARGAEDLSLPAAVPETRNAVHPDGTLHGLEIAAGETMRLWDYDNETPIPIHVTEPLQIDPAGTLRIVIDDAEWGSTGTFAAGTNVALDGTLELLVEPETGVTLASLVGVTFPLFDWTGVEPVGTFDVSSPYQWDLTNLYVTGEATLTAVSGLAGDFDQNGVVDGADFLAWQRGASTSPLSPADLTEWQSQFGAITAAASAAAVPETSGVFMLVAASGALAVRSRSRPL